MSLERAAIAANRFGFGATPGLLQKIKSDPRGWLLEQIARDVPVPPPIASLPPTGADHLAFPLVRRLALPREGYGTDEQRQPAMEPRMPGQQGAGMSGEAGQGLALIARMRTARMSAALAARFETAIQTTSPFRERLVHFWSNHFVVSAAKATAFAMPASFERDVARKHVGHRFEAMLVASTKHPAMLFYLDNYLSIGPNSQWARDPSRVPVVSQGVGRPQGLNENLAREILELHTMGVNGGYTQADVTNFAKVITGWGYDLRQRRAGDLAAIARRGADDVFYFNAAAHEPGPQVVLGKTYAGDGVEKGLSVLRDLARLPQVAEFVARKLARHFIADEPPTAAVASLARAFRDSDGDLPSVYRALVEVPEAWDPSLRKTKRPEEFLVSTMRALGGPKLEGAHLLRLLQQMGQPAFSPSGPDGWPDNGAFWSGADALWKRIEWATLAAERQAPARPDPAALAVDVLGPLVSEKTLAEIRRAESPEQGLALFLVSPEFMRR